MSCPVPWARGAAAATLLLGGALLSACSQPGGSTAPTARPANKHPTTLLPDRWSSVPDPPPAARTAAVQAGAWSVDPVAEVTFPPTARPLALVFVSGREPLVEVRDLAAGKLLGAVRDKDVRDPLRAVSPDGRLLAVRLNRSEADRIRIWSVETGASVKDVELPRQSGVGPVSALCIASDDSLLALRSGASCWQAVVVPVRGDQSPREFQLAANKGQVVWPETLSVSPGGKYLAVAGGKQVLVHELATGKCAGTLELPPLPDGLVRRSELVFSPDGRQVATLVMPPGATFDVRLLVWDFSAGRLVADRTFDALPLVRRSEEFHPSRVESPLRWLPDGSGWLFLGCLIWKRDADAPEPGVIGPLDLMPRTMVGGEHVAMVARQRNETQVAVVPLAAARAAAAPAAVAAATQPAPWSVEADGAAAPFTPPAKPQAIFGVVPGMPQLPHRPSPFAALSSGGEYLVLDMAAGAIVRRFSAGSRQQSPEVGDISPDGRFIVTCRQSDRDTGVTLAVWDVSRGQIIFERQESSARGEVKAEFLSSDRLLVTTDPEGVPGRRYVVWEVPQGTKRLEADSPKDWGSAVWHSHAVSPGGNYAVAVYGNKLGAVSLTDGKECGRLPLSSALGRLVPQDVGGPVFTRDGREIYALIRVSGGPGRVQGWDVAAGKLIVDREVNEQSLAALAQDHRSQWLRPMPWFAGKPDWLVYGSGAVNVASGEVVGPLSLSRWAPVLTLGDGQLLAGHVETSLKGDPAAALVTVPVQSESGTGLASKLAALRPPPTAVAAKTPASSAPLPPVPRPGSTPPHRSPATSKSLKTPAPRPAWMACVDPPPEARQFISPKTLDIEVPRRHRFIASLHGGPLIAVIDEDREEGQVFHLGTGKAAGKKFPYSGSNTAAAIDAAGRYVAYESADHNLYVVNLETGALSVVRRCESFEDPHWLEFDRDGNLVVAMWEDRGMTIEVLPPTGGKPLRTIRTDRAAANSGRGGQVALSPGGRHLAVLTFDAVRIYDLTVDGPPQLALFPFPRRNLENSFFSADALVFSPDGKELAALYSGPSVEMLTIWSMETGQFVLHRPYRHKLTLRTIEESSHASKLAWFPGGQMLLAEGATLVDRSTAAPFWVLSQQDYYSVLPLTPADILVVAASLSGQSYHLRPAQVSKSEIDAAQRVVRAAASESVPTLTPIDPAAPMDVSQSDPPAAGAFVPDPLAGRLPKGPIQLQREPIDAMPLRVFFSRPEAATAVVQSAVNYLSVSRPVIRSGPLTPERANYLDVYDLTSGKHRHRLEIPASCDAIDVSPDGSLVLTASVGRYDVWSPQLGRHAAGWQPLPVDTDLDDLATWAAFLDKRHVLVFAAGNLTCWELPACKRIYRIEARIPPVLSPGRKQMLHWPPYGSKAPPTIRDTATGKALLQVPKSESSPDPSMLINAVFHPDGKQLTGLGSHGGALHVVRFDLAANLLLDHFAVPGARTDLLYLLDGRGILLAYSGSLPGAHFELIDFESRQIDSLLKPEGPILAGASDGTLWRCVLASSGGKPDYYLQGFAGDQFPRSGALPFPPKYALVAPGSRVALDLMAPPAELAAARATMEKKLKDCGWTIDNAAPVRVVVRMQPSIKTLRAGPPAISTPWMTVSEEIVDASGKTLHMRPPYDRPHPPPDELGPLKWLEMIGLPHYLFENDWERHLARGEFPAVTP